VSKREPGLIRRFGGHAMAAGLSIAEQDFPRFEQVFESVCGQLLTPELLARVVETDGELESVEMTLELARQLRAEVWGQAFPEPAFVGEFEVEQQRVVGEKHLKLRLKKHGHLFDAMMFFATDSLPEQVRAVYRLDVNEYNGNTTLQLLLSHWEAS
jgi:single-stranded-DNA-specific exonuclease